QVVATLRGRLGQQAQVGGDELPLFVTAIAGRGASVHAPSLRGWRGQFITPYQARQALLAGVDAGVRLASTDEEVKVARSVVVRGIHVSSLARALMRAAEHRWTVCARARCEGTV